jgi:hypothetical protein
MLDAAVDPVVLDSHLVDAAMVEPWIDVHEFAMLRGIALERLVHEFLANRLEVGALVRPPLRDLIATGNAEDD